MAKNESVSSTVQRLKGNAKVSVGKATGNRSLEAKGKADKTKASIADAKTDVKRAASHLRDAVRPD